ncbi:NAD(P)-dependent dehydrogenase (short-subunit alcohol dehydrogenase family) [Novosphingobium chloroacetimidivorans]|uniref:NAD(P)-dependent dehydrogenase (Short-subunit alcohol dehydrogenase family) n=1 Tax=Novosphingobium chloroacetimidivorans TaxID=1428314 RepID=A0A7W7NVM1_9SPHN|nr:SDR family NAD(P)-dependent oxidoreductase [Novosphingobium chloroacetimidivorans]MBB4858668.1 NAD(P)-dependent dehydrogenase (short-subunit alcohol dehydrogenase family) [Novosphingobium chloroacetimidivorans]
MFDALRLDEKVAVITGAAGGIGSTTARLMAGRGARVVIADIAFEAAEKLAQEIGDNALAVHLDLADSDSIRAAIARTVDHFGRLDILVNNAAATGGGLTEADGLLHAMEDWVWDRSFQVNCRGTMVITREALPHLLKTRGCIVNTVSGLGLQGHVHQTAYGATKAAIVQLTRSLATAYGRQGVRCNAVAPGLILTPVIAKDFPPKWRALVEDETPRGTAGGPEDIAEPIAFLASDAAKNITGQTLVSDGGVSVHIPGLKAYSEAFGIPFDPVETLG